MQEITSFAIQSGLPLSTISLILMLPILVTMIAFFRQVIGIKAFGIYTPALVTFAFLTSEKLIYGIAIFVTAIIVGLFARWILKPIRLLYLPRVAIVITLVSIAVFAILILAGWWRQNGLPNVSILPIIIMIALVEKIITTQIEKGPRPAIILTVETLLISIIGYYLITWPALINFILKYPLVVLAVIPINLLIGKWTGLRLTEYYRFKEILKKRHV